MLYRFIPPRDKSLGYLHDAPPGLTLKRGARPCAPTTAPPPHPYLEENLSSPGLKAGAIDDRT